MSFSIDITPEVRVSKPNNYSSKGRAVSAVSKLPLSLVVTQALSALRPNTLKSAYSPSEKAANAFRPAKPEKFKNATINGNFKICVLNKTRSGRPPNYLDAIIFEGGSEPHVQNFLKLCQKLCLIMLIKCW